VTVPDTNAPVLWEHLTDMRSVERLEAIFDQRRSLIVNIDDLAAYDHVCSEPDCCEVPLRFPPELWDMLAPLGWVYALATYEGEVLYIGKTQHRLHLRMKQHNSGHGPMWHLAMRTRRFPDVVVGWNVGADCDRYERAALLVMQPFLNTASLL
jgi:hypothetical protein